jgi:superfamily II DNA or RNA helicase
MYSLLSNETAEALRSFLHSVVPEISDDWWNRTVISALTFQQQRMVEEKQISCLAGLDLAALLRILDKNWSDISFKRNLGNEARTWTREMQHIRNKWAHAAGTPPEMEDLYRDLDTLQRFLTAINADVGLTANVRERKQACMKTSVTGSEGVLPVISTATEFILGNTVILKADPTVIGAVIQVTPGQPENRYLVLVGSKPTPFYASQLVKLDLAETSNNKPIALDAFHAHLSALQLQHPGLANLYSLNAARVNYIPYQFKPVMKLISSDRPRILIADEVGVGKTIEAGLILRELQARRDLESVLIICPRPLVTESKWRNEMKRFDEEFVHLDGPTLRNCIDETDKEGCWPTGYARAILPFSLFSDELLVGTQDAKTRKRKGLLDLEPLPHFDLIIVDEAHHLRNPDTCLHRGIQFLCANAEAVVFLSATPIQLGANDLFVLLNLLRPDLIIDSAVFTQMSEPNRYINMAIELARKAHLEWQGEARNLLTHAAQTNWGRAILQPNPDFQRIHDLLADATLGDQERVEFIRSTERLHSFSTIINRTRRRDIGTVFTTRCSETVEVPFSPSQQHLHDEILAIQAKILTQIHGDRNLMFMMTTIRRQAASCIYGLAPFLKDILTRRFDMLELDEIDNEVGEGPISVDTIEGRVNEIIALAELLDPYDPKLEALLKIISDKQLLPNNKILLFSSFRHTLAYLLTNLENAGVRIGYIHGNTPDEDRRDQRNRFSLPSHESEALDILLSSEVGCEGLDYQFCDCLVNYDLPWNPMRIEQRIGRIDRYGQESPKVAIYNLITPGTVDADIYYRCLERIGVFQAALGGSEEIIGRLTTKLREVTENLSLSEEDRQSRLQQLSDNEIRVIREQEDLEDQQGELFGLRLPQSHDEDVKQASSFWLTPEALLRLVKQYLNQLIAQNQEYVLGEKPRKNLRISQTGREALLRDFRQLPRKASPLYRDWEKWLKGNEQHLAVTFNAECASQNRDTVFITPIHPLAIQAARAVGIDQMHYTAFRVRDAALKPGSYPFAIYHWQKKGIREDVTFQPVCGDVSISSRFLHLLEQGDMISPESIVLPPPPVFDDLDSHHHALWVAARSEHISHDFELVRFRRQSLKTSHKARMAVLMEQLDSTTNDKIRLMRKSQLDSAEADFARRMQELDQAENKADITSQPVAFGVMVVESKD